MSNMVLFTYHNHVVVQNQYGDLEVINDSGDCFYIRLDDSKTSGYRKLIEMDYKEQLKSSIEYINWIIHNKRMKL